MTSKPRKWLGELEQVLNDRITGEWDAPENRQIERDMAFFARILRKEKEAEK